MRVDTSNINVVQLSSQLVEYSCSRSVSSDSTKLDMMYTDSRHATKDLRWDMKRCLVPGVLVLRPRLAYTANTHPLKSMQVRLSACAAGWKGYCLCVVTGIVKRSEMRFAKCLYIPQLHAVAADGHKRGSLVFI